MKRYHILFILLSLALLLSIRAQAAEFAGGTGVADDPYQIATPAQLIAIGEDPNLHDKHFVLIADLDLDPVSGSGYIFSGAVLTWGGKRRSSYPTRVFEGYFDGNGHVITNCILSAAFQFTGLFESIGSGGVVTNLHIENMLVIENNSSDSNRSHCGALAGHNEGGVVNCSATGTILADSAERDPLAGGGLIGVNSGVVVGCQSSCDIFGERVGGLIGANEETGRIVSCSSGAMVVGGWISGGLVGTNAGVIQYSHAGGDVFGSAAGGLVGQNNGMVRECYAKPTIAQGGLVGRNSGSVVDCYTAGTIVSDSGAAGVVLWNEGRITRSYSALSRRYQGLGPIPLPLVGTARSSGYVQQCYYLTTEKTDEFDPSETGTPLLAEEMEDKESFAGFDFHQDANDGPVGAWWMPETGAPLLTWQPEGGDLRAIPDISGMRLLPARVLLESLGYVVGSVVYDYSNAIPACDPDSESGEDCSERDRYVIGTRPSGYVPLDSPVELVLSLGPYDFADNAGDGSESNPYQIETAGQLEALSYRANRETDHFILMQDIDLTNVVYPASLIARFFGSFNGNGHVVRYRGRNGLFGVVELNAAVYDLILEQVRIENGSYGSASDMIGALAGYNKGLIHHCSTHGSITGGATYMHVGGLVGYNAGQIVDSCARMQMKGDPIGGSVGGLVGHNRGVVHTCYAWGTVLSDASCVGGLIGVNCGGEARVENSYARGDVHGGLYVGGLVGGNFLVGSRGTCGASWDGGPVIVVRSCYSACSVEGQTDVGGCIGYAEPNALQEDSYFLAEADGGGADNGFGTMLSEAQMRQQGSFTGWDFGNVWTICEDADYPRLQWEGVDCR